MFFFFFFFQNIDNDGVPDYLDLDSDNDGILDVQEHGSKFVGKNSQTLRGMANPQSGGLPNDSDCCAPYQTNAWRLTGQSSLTSSTTDILAAPYYKAPGMMCEAKAIADTSNTNKDKYPNNMALSQNHCGHFDFRDADADGDGISDTEECGKDVVGKSFTAFNFDCSGLDYSGCEEYATDTVNGWDGGAIECGRQGKMPAENTCVTLCGAGGTCRYSQACTCRKWNGREYDNNAKNENLVIVVDGITQIVNVNVNCDTVENCATRLTSLINGASVSAVDGNLVITSANPSGNVMLGLGRGGLSDSYRRYNTVNNQHNPNEVVRLTGSNVQTLFLTDVNDEYDPNCRDTDGK